jgi:hypothetical protein
MFEFISEAAEGLEDLIGVAMTAPLSYFLGLGLVAGIVAIVMKIAKRKG